MLDLEQLWEKYSDEFLKFNRVQNKLSSRADLHAFLLLDRLLPGDEDIVACAEHDEIWLSFDTSELAKVITEEQVVELIRCGIRYDGANNSLSSFV